MDLKFLWTFDRKSQEDSITLTLLWVSFLLTIIVGGLNAFGVVESTSIFTEILYSTIALYGGRKFMANGKTFSSEKAEEIIEKVENK